MNKGKHTIELLRALRHNWLNDIQLIKANLDLNRVERAKTIIDEIIVREQNGAHLSNLGATEFASYLSTYNLLHNKPLTLELEVTGDGMNLSPIDGDLTAFVNTLFQTFEKAVDNQFENTILFSIDVINDTVVISVDFSGQIKDLALFHTDWAEKFPNQSIALVRNYIKEDEAVFVFSIH